jgi:DNA-binding beta-propeller fold protein YncE
MWVTTQGDQLVSSYNINLTTGGTSQVGGGVATGAGPVAIAITPAGDALFVANRDDNTISSYGLNSDGSLKAQGTPVKAGELPVALAIDPTGAFLFVANQGDFADPTSGTVSVFNIKSGALTPAGVYPTVLASGTGTGPSAIVVAPVGNFLYVANQFSSSISIFSYDSSGTLTLNPTPVIAGTNPAGLAFSRCAGTTTANTNCPAAAPPAYLFVANSGSNNISIFSACFQVTIACPSANGALTQVGNSPVGAGVRPISFMISPVRNLVYTVDNGSFQVSEYRYDSATGGLTVLSPSSISTGASPLTGGITSDGNWVFVPNNGGSSLSGYGLSTTGPLTVGTSISLAGQPSAVLIR